MRQRYFPFLARVNGQVVSVTGVHWSGHYLESDAGLLSLDTQPLSLAEIPQTASYFRETPDRPANQPLWTGDGKWVRKGFFKERRPPNPDERAMKAECAGMWLQTALHDGPLPAAVILQAAKEFGISYWGLRRAKRAHGVKFVKVGAGTKVGALYGCGNSPKCRNYKICEDESLHPLSLAVFR
jgi:hypothetical protein